MARVTFEHFIVLMIDDIKLHGKTLCTLNWNGFVIDYCQEVLICCHSYDDSIESYTFELVSSNVNYLDFFIIGNGHPLIWACNGSDILPVFFPGFSIIKAFIFYSFQELDSILSLIGIDYKLSIEVTIKNLFVFKKTLWSWFIFDFELNTPIKFSFVLKYEVSLMWRT